MRGGVVKIVLGLLAPFFFLWLGPLLYRPCSLRYVTTSALSSRPRGPLPRTVLKSNWWSRANCRTAGDVRTLRRVVAVVATTVTVVVVVTLEVELGRHGGNAHSEFSSSSSWSFLEAVPSPFWFVSCNLPADAAALLLIQHRHCCHHPPLLRFMMGRRL